MWKSLTAIFITLFFLNFPISLQADVNNIFTLKKNSLLDKFTIQKKYMPCRYEMVNPYKGKLYIQSKYDQNDTSKSKLLTSPDLSSQKIKKQIQKFSKKLVSYSDSAINSNDKQKVKIAINCYKQQLSLWANSEALLTTNANKTGNAVRKWALAVISTTVIKLYAATHGNFKITAQEKLWITSLSNLVIKNYDNRIKSRYKGINNHDYWAAWAVVASGIAVDDSRFLNWGMKIYSYAMEQVYVPAGEDYGYLPNELARASLAENYTNYALVPIIFLAESARVNNRYNKQQVDKLKKLVNFTCLMVLNKQKLTGILNNKQKPVSRYKYIWLYPFLNHYPKHKLARQLMEYFDGNVDQYSQAGGSVKKFYSIKY